MSIPTPILIDKQQYRKDNIEAMMAWSLEQKIEHAKKRILEFYEAMDGKVYVSFSGGKDSTVLLHLVRSIFPDVVAVFINTTNEYVEILHFIKHMKNVITLYPKMSFNQTVEKYGFPLVSKEVAQKVYELKHTSSIKLREIRLNGYNGTFSGRLSKKWLFLTTATFDLTHKCCYFLKKEPLYRFEKDYGLNPIIGTSIFESRNRKSDWVRYGCNTFTSRAKSRPLSIWTEQDVWDYIKRFNVPYSKIYDDVLDNRGNVLIQGEKRTGCAYCAFGAEQEKASLLELNRFQRLKLRKPKQYRAMMKLQNNGVSYDEALRFIHVKH